MNKNLSSIIITTVLIAVGGLLIISYGNGSLAQIWSSVFKPDASLDQIILFYGAECPHCQNVEKYISDNKIDQKVKFIRLEVPFGNRNNSQLQANSRVLLGRAQACGITTTQVAIPFMWNGKSKTCLLGDQDIINYFKNAAEIK